MLDEGEEPPLLRILLAGANTLKVLWPSAYSAFQLQQTTNLPMDLWTLPSEPVLDDGTNRYILLISPLGPVRFYRLKQP